MRFATSGLLMLLTVASLMPSAAQSRDGRHDGTAAEPAFRHVAHSGGHATWCTLHSAKREYRLAIEDCDEALRQTPDSDDIYSSRGAAYLMMREPARAIADFTAAITRNPADATYHYNRGAAHAMQGDSLAAISDYSAAIALEPRLAPAYNNRAAEYEKVGERAKAIADYRMALALAPSLSAIRDNLRRLGAAID